MKATNSGSPAAPLRSIALCLLFLALVGPGSIQAADNPDWMTKNWDTIKGKTLRQLVIPGTHDSGAYDLVNPWEIFDSRFYKLGTDFAGPDTDSAAKGPLNAGPFFEHWSQTQSKSIYDQLKAGIRALDIRAAVDPKGSFRIVHSLYGDTIDIVLDDIAKFSKEQPEELIHVRFDHFHDVGLRTQPAADATDAAKKAAFEGGRDKMRGSKHAELRDLISTKIGDRLILNWTPTMTLEALRVAGSPRRILLFYAEKTDSSGFSIPDRPGFISNSSFANNLDWVGDTADNETPAKFKQLTLAKIETFRNSTQLHRLGAVTPTTKQYDAWYQGGDFGGTNPKSLRGYAEDTNPVIAKWIRDEWAQKNLNIIHMDFFPDYLVPLCLQLNGIAVPTFTIPDDDDWGNYKTLSELLTKAANAVANWTTTAVKDVGDWFSTAWSDVSAFFTSVANGVSSFFTQSFEAPVAGTPPTAVAAGVRHYVVTVHEIQVLSSGDDAGTDLELYGQAFIVPNDFCYVDAGANKTLWSRSESDAVTVKQFASLTINASKNLYVRESDANGARVAVGGVFLDNDDSIFGGGGDDEMKLDKGLRSGPLEFYLGSIEEGQRQEGRVEYVQDAKGRVAVRFSVERKVAPVIPQVPGLTWTIPTPLVLVDRRTPVGTGLLKAVAGVAGRIEYVPPAGTHLQPGTVLQVRARFIPTDTRRYRETEISQLVHVLPVFRAVPGRIEAEDYDAFFVRFSEAPPAEVTSDAGGGSNIHSMNSGDWTAYNFFAGASAQYVPKLRVSAESVGQLRVLIDGQDFPGNVITPPPLGLSSWMTVGLPAVALSAGQHRVDVRWEGNRVNLNYLDFEFPQKDEYRQNFDQFADGTTALNDGSTLESTHLGQVTRVQGGALRMTESSTPDTVAKFVVPPLSQEGLPTHLGFEASFVKEGYGFSFQYGELQLEFGLVGVSAKVNGQSVPGAVGVELNPGGIRGGTPVTIRWSKQSGMGRLTVVSHGVVRAAEVETPGFNPDATSQMYFRALSGSAELIFRNFAVIDDILVRKLDPETRILQIEGSTDLGAVTLFDQPREGGGRIFVYSGRFEIVNEGSAPLTVRSMRAPAGVSIVGWQSGTLPPGGRQAVQFHHAPNGDGHYQVPIVIQSDATAGADAFGELRIVFHAFVPGEPSRSKLLARFPLDFDGNSVDGSFVASEVKDVEFGIPGATASTGGAARFNGASSRIQHPWNGAFNSGTANAAESFTITAWARPETSPDYQSVVTSRIAQSPDSTGFVLYDSPGGAWEFWSGNGPGPDEWQVTTGPAALPGQWQHLALVYDAGKPRKTLFVNGEPVKSDDAAIGANLQRPLNIGAGGDLGENFFFKGDIDDVAIFAGALTRAEIGEVMGGDFTRFVPLPDRRLELAGSTDLGTLEAVEGRVAGRFTLVNRGTAPLTIRSFALPTGVNLDWPGGTIAPQGSREIILAAEAAQAGPVTWDLEVNSDATTGADPSGKTALRFNAVIKVTHGLNRLFYRARPGLTLDDFYPAPRGKGVFPTGAEPVGAAPTQSGIVTNFEAPPEIGEDYGQILHGYIVPTDTADYTFYMCSDDQGELWLSTDEDPANSRLIASEPEWNPSRTWDSAERRPVANGRRANVSPSIRLEAGRYYYVEAVMKEASGGDNLGVTWARTGAPAPANGSEPIASTFLRTEGPNPSGPTDRLLLTISQGGVGLVITWPNTPGFILERTDRLAPDASWSNVPFTISGATATAPANPNASTAFYRLRKP